MPIKWKKGDRFKPQILLDRLNGIRTWTPGKGSVFRGWELNNIVHALESLLAFPPAAESDVRGHLVRRAASHTPDVLTCKSFEDEINRQLSEHLAKPFEEFHLLTSVSIDVASKPRNVRRDGVQIRFVGRTYPAMFKSRSPWLASIVPEDKTPDDYCKVIVTLKARTAAGAVTRGLRAFDLERSAWVRQANSSAELVGNSGHQLTRFA